MIQAIVLHNKHHNILSTPPRKVDIATEKDDVIALVKDMTDTMEAAGGLGLAANQIGRNLSVCICKINDTLVPMVNPEIIEATGNDEISEEGCLSLPDVIVRVLRKETVKVKFIDPTNWIETEMVIDFPYSVVPQHEIDHLNGKLIIDYMTPMQRDLARTKLKRIARGNMPINYVGMVWRESKRSWALVGNYAQLLRFYSEQTQAKQQQANLDKITDSAETNIITIGEANGTSEVNTQEEATQ